MKNIAFVDDEKNVLDGLRRMLHSYRNKWKMHFFTSGEEALKAIDNGSFDVIISDMHMPKMNGAQVLTNVKTNHPNISRLALSGYAKEEIVLESLQVTQRFIAKPASKEEIIQSIERALSLQELLQNEGMKNLLGGINSLPVIPEIYNKLMAEVASEDASIARIAEIVETDVALTASILKIVNSAFFGLVTHVASPTQAATILGMDTIKNIALSTKVFMAISDGNKNIAELSKLNNFAQKVGLLASKLVKKSKLQNRARDHAHIAAMMINVGEIILLAHTKAFEKNNIEKLAPSLLAGYLLGLWSMPFPLIEAVRWHRNPKDSGIEELSPLTVAHAAWAMVKMQEQDGEINFDSDLIDREYLYSAIGEKNTEEWLEVGKEFFAGEALHA